MIENHSPEHLTPPIECSIGERFKKAREDRQWTLTEVASRLRLKPHYIEMIEHDDFHTLPKGIFLRGYIRLYAKLLDISDEDVQIALQSVEAYTPPFPINTHIHSTKIKNKKNSWLWITYALILLSIIAICVEWITLR